MQWVGRGLDMSYGIFDIVVNAFQLDALVVDDVPKLSEECPWRWMGVTGKGDRTDEWAIGVSATVRAN